MKTLMNAVLLAVLGPLMLLLLPWTARTERRPEPIRVDRDAAHRRPPFRKDDR